METGIITLNPGLLAGLAGGGIGGIDVMPRELLVLECLAAGTSFRNLKEIEPKIPADVKLELKREAANEHDDFAVSFWFEDSKIGYIPRDKNEVIARLMEGGKRFFAKICSREWEGNWLKLEVSVWLKD